MFTNVGVNPFGPGGAPVSSQPQSAQSPTDPGKEATGSARGEAAASSDAPQTAERVDPARQSDPTARLRDGERRDEPDRDSPIGPIPSFDRSPIEARRQELAAPPPPPEPSDAAAPAGIDASTADDPRASDSTETPDPLRDAISQIVDDAPRLEVPPSAEERAEVEFTSIRTRDAADGDGPRVDVTA